LKIFHLSSHSKKWRRERGKGRERGEEGTEERGREEGVSGGILLIFVIALSWLIL